MLSHLLLGRLMRHAPSYRSEGKNGYRFWSAEFEERFENEVKKAASVVGLATLAAEELALKSLRHLAVGKVFAARLEVKAYLSKALSRTLPGGQTL